MPLRIGFPSTLTWRSRIARSATRDSAERGLARRRPRELREVHAVERRGDARLQAKPDRSRAAALLADAVQHGIALGGADLRLDRTLERTDDVAGRDLRRISGEEIPAPGPALPVHEARSPQRRDELLEIRERQILALGDGVQRHRPLTPVALERTDAEIAFGLEGGATLDGERAWLTGHVIALARDGRLGEAAWGRMLLPPAATSRLIAGEELGDVIDDLFGRKESKRQTGAIGLLTENVVTRTDAFADLVAMACAPFLHPELYQPGPNRRIRTI